MIRSQLGTEYITGNDRASMLDYIRFNEQISVVDRLQRFTKVVGFQFVDAK